MLAHGAAGRPTEGKTCHDVSRPAHDCAKKLSRDPIQGHHPPSGQGFTPQTGRLCARARVLVKTIYSFLSILIYSYIKLTTMKPSAGVGQLQIFKAGFFKALAHPLRIRVLEILVQGDRSVQELQEMLGVDQPAVSQQLAVLREKNIVDTHKEGTVVRYAVRDPALRDLLAVARRIFDRHLIGSQAMLRELRREARRR